MTYIQLALLGIPAKVIQGDSLSLIFRQELYTPFYFLNGIEYKLKKQKLSEKKLVIEKEDKPNLSIQLSLF